MQPARKIENQGEIQDKQTFYWKTSLQYKISGENTGRAENKTRVFY